ncbi:NADP-dependent 3-hydroxy acid dehydrogenase YdfG [Rhizobium sp. BK456]|nr:NADP-dependent 3-hydroxy acid dehydrogenase YdfG [Rhizobium sp. BK456]
MLEHTTEQDNQKSNRDYVGTVGVSAETFGQMVALAISQPVDVDVNDILFRPTMQEL